MPKEKIYSVCINGIDNFVNKNVYDLVQQLKNENEFMVYLLQEKN
jgi:ABC-type Na+ transport system ATPase subunit NatA